MIRASMSRRTAPLLRLSAVFLASMLSGCVTSGVPYAGEVPPVQVDPSTRGPVSGVGIEGHDIVVPLESTGRARDRVNVYRRYLIIFRVKVTPHLLVVSILWAWQSASSAARRPLCARRAPVRGDCAARRLTFVLCLTTTRIPLARVPAQLKVELAILFGSRASGDHRPDSDADLALILERERIRVL